MNMSTNNLNNLNATFGLITPAPESSVHVYPRLLSRSMVLPQRVSLIDNSLAQACSLKRARISKSDGNMNTDGVKFSYKSRTPGSTLKIVSTGNSPSSSSSDLRKTLHENMCPYTFIESVLIGNDADENDDHPERQQQMQPLHESEFLTPTAEQIAAYNNDAITAVRTSNIEALREIYSQGQTLGCCNRFGESLLHVACRRSNADVVSFLLHEANVSPRIKDDYGRTPLHDACWRGNPEYRIVELLLGVEPRLAFVQDVRGHKPFQYARREHWGAWREFLDEKRDLILS